MQIAVIDLGIGNLRSVEQAMKTVADAKVEITSDAGVIASADRLVLPGQGAIGTWFKSLDDNNLREIVLKAMNEKPVLGICVGMQALFSFCAEDGGMPGLDIFPGSVNHFKDFHAKDSSLTIPQMGWNKVAQTQPHPLWQGIEDQSYFYFVHSYCANLAKDSDSNAVYGTADYGHEFIAAIGGKNVFALQFHPEKSHRDGLQLLKNFSAWDGRI